MFDLDRLAAFDRGLSSLPPAVVGAGREAGQPGCAAAVLAHAAEEDAPALRCTMIDRLGVEPMCPFARVEAA